MICRLDWVFFKMPDKGVIHALSRERSEEPQPVQDVTQGREDTSPEQDRAILCSLLTRRRADTLSPSFLRPHLSYFTLVPSLCCLHGTSLILFLPVEFLFKLNVTSCGSIQDFQKLPDMACKMMLWKKPNLFGVDELDFLNFGFVPY